MSPAHPLLAQVSNDLLCVGTRAQRDDINRAKALIRWFGTRGYRPTFTELEDERARRKAQQ